MNKRSILLVAGGVVVLGLVLLFVAHVPQRLADDLLYDNYNHYLPCERLPPATEIERGLAENAAVIDKIRAVSPDVDIQIDEMICHGTDHTDLIISYPGHSQRVEIERILGGKTFFGLPVRWRNW